MVATIYLLKYAPVPWKFDAKSALIGAVIALVLAGLVYYFRKTLRQGWQQSILAPLAKLSLWLQASTEDSYRELVIKRAQSLVVPAQAAPLDAVFVEPTLLAPTPPPQAIADIETHQASQVLPLRQVLGQHSQLIILGAAGTGKTTLLAYLALACAHTAKDRAETQAPMGAVYGRLPLYVPLSAMNWDGPDDTTQTDDAQADNVQADDIQADDAQSDDAQAEKETKKQVPELGPVDRLIDAAVAVVGGNKSMMKILREYLEGQRAIVLVDGWAELSLQHHQLATAWISKVIETIPGNFWLVGAEPRGYAPLTEIGFVSLKLMTWSAEQVELFAKQWVQAYTPADSQEPTAVPRQLTAALRRAMRAGARPLELALRTFVHLSDEQTPAVRAALFEHVLNSMLRPDKEEERPWLLPACRAVLEQLALDLQQAERATVSREEIETAIESVLPPPEERPARADAHVFRALAGKRGLLYPTAAGRYTFTHPLWQAYLAAYRLLTSDPIDLIERLGDAHWAETLRFYAQIGNMGPLVASWLREPDDLFRTNMRTLSSWIEAAPANAAWRDQAMAVLARSFLQSKPPARIQQGLAESLAATGLKGVTYLFKQALRHPDAGLRKAAVMGLTMASTAGDSDLPTLEAALEDQDPGVREETVRGLVRLDTVAATRWLARIFMEEEESLSLVAAEALAQCGDEGAEFLREAVELEDTVARRAAVYGLAQIGARDLLTKLAREDEQWIVRSAATMALDEIEERENISGITPPPEIDQLSWLISWAATKGEGVGLGVAAQNMLRRALTEGDAPIRVAAARVLAQIGHPDDVESLRAALNGPDPDVANAALEALTEIGERYVLRIT